MKSASAMCDWCGQPASRTCDTVVTWVETEQEITITTCDSNLCEACGKSSWTSLKRPGGLETVDKCPWCIAHPSPPNSLAPADFLARRRAFAAVVRRRNFAIVPKVADP